MMRVAQPGRAGVLALMLLLAAVPVAAADRDGDGLRDGFETRWGVTSPDDRDSDNDGVVDSAEDLDRDDLSNLGEQRFGTNPGKRDSDGDGKPDGREDHDRDGKSNAKEQDQRRVPVRLRPRLPVADEDLQPLKKECQTKHGFSRITSCAFGPSDSATDVVLAGDSHAMMLLTPFKEVAVAQGWRLKTMTKSSCTILLGLTGNLQWELDKGRSCRRWRRNVIERLQADPPDLLVIAHAPTYKLRTIKGRAIPKPERTGEWKRALQRTVARLPAQTKVLALGGVPRNWGNPVTCLRAHPRNMSRCVTAKVPFDQRHMDKGLRRAVATNAAIYRTLYGKTCTYDPCPLVQGDVMMWRDTSHLSETFAKQLKPSIRRILEDVLIAPASRR